MSEIKKSGFLRLAKQSFAVLAASLASMTSSKASPVVENTIPVADKANPELNRDFKKVPRLVLKLRKSDLSKSSVVMHTSHRSHSSHSSHSSHYSSSSSYTPSRSTGYGYSSGSSSSSSLSSSSGYSSGSSISKKTTSVIQKSGTTSATIGTATWYRTLYKGCEGTDVELLQNLLIRLKLGNANTGYFGDQTEQAVVKFQKDNELKPDGRVDERTFLLIKKKANGF